MTPRQRIVAAWAPAVAYMALIWTMSSISAPISLDSVPFEDKGAHAAEYAGLSALLLHALAGTFKRAPYTLLLLGAMASATLWGLLDEIHQAYVPGRVSDAQDLVADAVGSVIGATLYLLVSRALRALKR